jgi:antirestriction protein ArdC
VVLLWATAQERGYESPRWLTFKQAIEAGGNVRKGEKGTTVIYTSAFEKEDDDGKAKRIAFLKAFTVFNLAQCDGLETIIEERKPRIINPNARDDIAEQFIASTGATVKHGEARAYYTTAGDYINLPMFETFTGAPEYYSTAFHELTHWTGASHRLNREFGKRFGDHSYAAEELVAELGSAFVCAEFGMDNDTLENSAAYIASWKKRLTENERLFVAAASAASKAVEFMRGLAIETQEQELAA